MYIVHVEVHVNTKRHFENLKELLDFIKKHLGGFYNDHDIAQIKSITQIQKTPQ
jgi:hypothetical protein